MKAMVLERIAPFDVNPEPLSLEEVDEPRISENQVLIKVTACGVCHTELDEIEGRTPPPRLPVVPGHQVVGRVERMGSEVRSLSIGQRVGVGWIHSSCGRCSYCLSGDENLCAEFKATGRDADGGYAELMAVDHRYVFPIPDLLTDTGAAPLLCAGAIGYRSLKLTGLRNGQSLGLTGFGASAHLVLLMVRHRFPNTKVHVFARNPRERAFALELGAAWAGATEEPSPEKLEAVIDTTPAFKPVIFALENLAPGGRLVINAIRKEDVDREQLLRLDYTRHLWMEKEIKSVANVARSDVAELLKLAAEIPMRPTVTEMELGEANRALMELKEGNIRGAKVLRIAE